MSQAKSPKDPSMIHVFFRKQMSPNEIPQGLLCKYLFVYVCLTDYISYRLPCFALALMWDGCIYV